MGSGANYGRWGGAALQLLRKAGSPYRVMLLDAMMPGIDGIELASRIRADAQHSEVTITMLSSLGDAENESRCREFGISTCLRKPVSPYDLQEALCRAIAPGSVDQTPTPVEVSDATPGLHILLAEDNKLNQMVASVLLKKLGHVVTIAEDGQQALDELRDGSFDAIVMDVQMPRLAGISATRKIRESEKSSGGHIPIIGLTADAMSGDRERFLAAGMDCCVSKPVRAEALLKALQDAVPDRPAG